MGHVQAAQNCSGPAKGHNNPVNYRPPPADGPELTWTHALIIDWPQVSDHSEVVLNNFKANMADDITVYAYGVQLAQAQIAAIPNMLALRQQFEMLQVGRLNPGMPDMPNVGADWG